MPSWIGQALQRGILTTRYPRAEATAEEVPPTGRAPRPTTAGPGATTATCPVGAIDGADVDAGRCIRCARCLSAGFEFTGPVESARARRADLVDSALPVSGAPGPLALLGPSLHVFMVDVGSCDACNREVLALANPLYDSSRLGIFFTSSPRHADVLVVVGVPTPEMTEPLRRAYDAMPAPKAVLAVGVCSVSGGVFAGAPGLTPGIVGLVPVDRFVPGCPPSPLTVLDALLQLRGRGRARPGGE